MRKERESTIAARARAKQLYEAGFKVRDIAKELKLTSRRVRLLLKEAGIQLKAHKQPSIRLHPKPEELLALRQKILAAASECKTWKEVAKKLGWSTAQLYYWRKTFEIGREALNKDITKEALEAAVRAGKSLAQISKEFGTSRSRLAWLTKSWGIPVQQRERRKEWLMGRNQQELAAKARELALAGTSMKEIATMLHVPYIFVYHELRRAGIHKARTRTS